MPGVRILDAPRYAWRGLSLDLARAFFTLDEVRCLFDLLGKYGQYICVAPDVGAVVVRFGCDWGVGNVTWSATLAVEERLSVVFTQGG